jgi:hypothetical protein
MKALLSHKIYIKQLCKLKKKNLFAEALVVAFFTVIFADFEHGCKHWIVYRCLVKKG